jgi:hypothetical protein
MPVWEEIRGFATGGEYDRFVQYLEGQVANGTARELPASALYGKGMIYGGRWFQDAETNAIWRLVAPDAPFRGLWEPVDLSTLERCPPPSAAENLN